VKWNSPEGARFRNHFISLENGTLEKPKRKKGNEEHRLESKILTDFNKRSSLEKALVGIQPVTLAGIRFGMPTSVGASGTSEAPVYSKQNGGSIDILARKRARDGKVYLHVIELKDKYESPVRVVKQAIQYAVFIRELLRSDSGEDWWRLFGFKRKLPEKLSITAMSLMPAKDKDNDFPFCGEYPLPGPNEDSICLDAGYFIEDGQKLRIITSERPQG
jgi:hypothetical protein